MEAVLPSHLQRAEGLLKQRQEVRDLVVTSPHPSTPGQHVGFWVDVTQADEACRMRKLGLCCHQSHHILPLNQIITNPSIYILSSPTFLLSVVGLEQGTHVPSIAQTSLFRTCMPSGSPRRSAAQNSPQLNLNSRSAMVFTSPFRVHMGSKGVLPPTNSSPLALDGVESVSGHHTHVKAFN